MPTPASTASSQPLKESEEVSSVPRRGVRIVPEIARRIRERLPKRVRRQDSRLARRPRGRRPSQPGAGVGIPGPDALVRQVQEALEEIIAEMSDSLKVGRNIVLREFLTLMVVEVPPQRRVNKWGGVKRDFITQGNYAVRLRVSKKLQHAITENTSQSGSEGDAQQ